MSFFPPINFKPQFRHFFIVMNSLDHAISLSLILCRFLFHLLLQRHFSLPVRCVIFQTRFIAIVRLHFYPFLNPLRKFTENDLLSGVREFLQPLYKVHTKSYLLFGFFLHASSELWDHCIYFSIWTKYKHLFSSASMKKTI